MTLSGLILRIIIALLFLVAGWWLARLGERLTERSLNRFKVDAMLVRFASSIARWTILTLVIIGALGAVGISTFSFAAVLGAAGLAIGLALQGVLQSLAAGVLILVQRPFKVGDFVRAGGETGTVVEVGLFTTLLDTPENKRIVVPNKTVFNGNIENITFHPRRRIDIPVGVSYEADLDETRATLEEAALAVPGGLAEPAPMVVLDSLADSSVNWQVRVWANGPEFLAVRQATIRAVKQALDAKGISIPFPQMDVHLAADKPDAPSEAPPKVIEPGA